MSNTLSRGANCALLDAVSLAECLTSPTYDRRSPTRLNTYVKENIERRLRERHRSSLMQRIMFFGQNCLKGYVRNKALPLALRRIDVLDREEHGVSEDWVADEGAWKEGSGSPQWAEELRWEELYDEEHGEGKEGSQSAESPRLSCQTTSSADRTMGMVVGDDEEFWEGPVHVHD